jgi:hypothetical protein
MPSNIYVDESIRNSYFLCAVQVDTSQISQLRLKAKMLRTNGQTSVHMQTETKSRQSQIATNISSFEFRAILFHVTRPGITDLSARRIALESMFMNSQMFSAQLITFDTSNSIQQDRRIISEVSRSKGINIPHYRHMNSRHEPLLWLPDIVAWCYGRGGLWRDAVEPLVNEVIEL